MPKYVIGFKKKGYVCYISHLDVMRLFQRAFKQEDIRLKYSKGYNPHPRMGFAQPLTLGYSSECELLEFETIENLTTRDITGRMRHAMDGILEISGCMRNDENKKTLASKGISIGYEVNIQLPETFPSSRAELISADRYLAQHEIIAEKKQKKSIKMKKVDIRQMIRSLECIVGNGKAVLEMQLDAGSISNLNPELVINTFVDFFMLGVPRHKIEVKRKNIEFSDNFQFIG